MPRRIAITFVLLWAAGCSIRYDATGVTRTGIGLWGFADPPGVDWNLDWPRRDVPELPASQRPELPPRAIGPESSRDDRGAITPQACRIDRSKSVIGDNRNCALRCRSEAGSSLADRDSDPGRVPACA